MSQSSIGKQVKLGPGAQRHPDRSQPFALGAPASVPDVATLGELLEHWADRRGERACAYFIGADESITSLCWGELRDRASRFASGLSAHGVTAGERVVLAVSTSAELIVAFFACQWLGALPCIIDAPVAGAGLAVWLERALPKLTLLDPRVVVTQDAMVEAVCGGLAAAQRQGAVVGASSFATCAPRDRADGAASGSAAIVQFTSGTTALPKAIVCSHRAVLANLRALGGEARQFHAGDLVVGWLPLFHDMGLIATLLTPLAHGVPTALMTPSAFVLRPARWLWVMHVLRGSISFAPNFAYRLCIRRLPEGDKQLAGLDLSSWRMAFNAAELVHVETARAFVTRFAPYGFPEHAIVPAYGLGEMVVGVSAHVHGTPMRIDVISRAALSLEGRAQPALPEHADPADRLEVVALGRVFGGHEVEIHSESGRALPERCQGEIVLRGPSLFDGYFRNPAATAAARRGAWLRTGDLGYVADGEIFITGRAKDLIIKGGENHHPYVLEEAASRVAGVRAGRVAAVGLVSASTGTEEVALLVETIEKSPEARQRIRRDIEASVQRVSGLRPDHVVLVPPNRVPMTTSGKIRRGSAREVIVEHLSA